MEYIQKDEYLEITPKSMRMRKIYLDENERARMSKKDALTPQQWTWVYAYGALVVVRFLIGGLKMVGFFKELS